MNLLITHSHNGIITKTNDDFKSATFNNVEDAKEFISDIIRYANFYGYVWESKSYFQIIEKIDDDTYNKIGSKIKIK